MNKAYGLVSQYKKTIIIENQAEIYSILKDKDLIMILFDLI